MVKEKSGYRSNTIENNQYYTPKHSYNTRLSARLNNSQGILINNIDNNKISKLLDDYSPSNDEPYTLGETDHHSDRLSTCSSEHTVNILFHEQLKRSFLKVGNMDFTENHCVDNDRRNYILRNCGIALIAVVIGWYVNHVRTQLVMMKSDLESNIVQMNAVQDARLDDVYKLTEMSKKVKDLTQNQMNLHQSINKMIEQEINKMYSDKTGRTDFALESAGGRIIQLSPETENYGQPKNSLLGISLCEGMHGPRAMIQAGTSPGECWAFKGSNGGAIIKLLGPVKIDAVSIEHISKNISPSGDSTTAPKDFTVWGLKTPTDRGTLLGQYSYNIEGPLVQMFALSQPSAETYEMVELRILSNHGNTDFTCIYRFRVHGELERQ